MGQMTRWGRGATVVRPGLFISYRLGGNAGPDLERVCLRNDVTPVDEDFIENIHRLYSQLRKWDESERVTSESSIFIDWEEPHRWARITRPAKPPHYHSFNAYFNWIKKLAWVEETRREIIEIGMVPQFSGGRWLERTKPEERPIRIYYKLTSEGLEAPLELWSNPKKVVAPMLAKVVAPILAVDVLKKKEVLQLLELTKKIQGLIEEKKYPQIKKLCQMLYDQTRSLSAKIEKTLPDMTDVMADKADDWLIILGEIEEIAGFLLRQAGLPPDLNPIIQAHREATLLTATIEIKEQLIALAAK